MQFEGSGNEQQGWRPGLVFQNNVGNRYSPNIIALPLTSNVKKETLPTHVVVKAEDSGLKKDSVVLCENPERMHKSRIGAFLTKLSDNYMKQVAEANLLATSAISYLDASALLATWEKATSLNSCK
jgi:mRNA interferase MazF